MVTSAERNILVTNRIARILGTLALATLVYLIYTFGINVNTPIILGLAAFFFVIPLINKAGMDRIARLLVCIVPVIATMVAAILAKVVERGHTDILFYDARFILLIFSIIPCLIFDTREKWLLYGSLAFVLLSLVMFDYLHEFFGVGYYQLGFTGRSYYYINVITVVTFMGIAGGGMTLKRAIERAEKQNEIFHKELQASNRRLQETLNDVEAQNEEIIAQSEELATSQESLVKANRTIEKQNQALAVQVNEVNAKLQQTNEELIKHTNELQQFSFTISHNLRGPTARLLGLAHLLKTTGELDANSEINEIVTHIQNSALDLDNVIRDLNAIVDIRHALYDIREDVQWNDIWEDVKRQLKISGSFEAAHFSVDFSQAPRIFSVIPMLRSILYHLVSNTIRFKSPERPLRVTITNWKKDSYVVLVVRDNGLGIDLNAFHRDIFKMYKRFHNHQEGRGLGLYLIKSQAELLNGFVDVNSEPDVGSTFVVHLPDPGRQG
jgi:Bacteriophytochrome (light-regulated signal transduction histidine kinase)